MEIHADRESARFSGPTIWIRYIFSHFQRGSFAADRSACQEQCNREANPERAGRNLALSDGGVAPEIRQRRR